MDDQQFLSALDSIDTQLSASHAGIAGALDGSQLCEQYKRIRGLLEAIIPVIRRIPVWGDKLAAALTFLMHLADTVCPA